MIIRTARGHTGRSLVISRIEAATYVLVMLAAFSRLMASLLTPEYYPVFLVLVAATWSFAYLIYLRQCTPWLLQTRLNGKDG